MESTSSRSRSGDLRAVAWWVLVGVAAGAIAGGLIGGVGGRLAMLVLRLTSPESVVGVISDDGFEIGVVTTDSISLVAGMAMLGGINGVLYVTLRGAIPPRLRLALWTLFGAAAGGATIVHDDGVDFTLIEPAVLAVTLFVALPGAVAALVVVLVERWVDREPFVDRRLAVLVGLAAVCGTFALVVGAVVAVGALLLRRVGLARPVSAIARVIVPLGLAALTIGALVDLVGTASRVL
ncbi:MAG: hypothetical protein ACRC50_07385 [Gaiella sp.]